MMMSLRRAFASGNASLLETFTQILASGNGTAARNKETKVAVGGDFGKIVLTAEPAVEFNDIKGFSTPATAELHRFKPGDVYNNYRAEDLVASRQGALPDLAAEVQTFVDPFKRHKCTADYQHKNTHLLSQMLSQTGKIIPQKLSGLSSKTQRHLSKVIRRARQMGLLPYMYRPKLFNGGRSMACPYEKPEWSAKASAHYKLEVLKGGVIIQEMRLDKEFHVFGRVEECDTVLEHPSSSRFHAVIQFSRDQAFVYDLGSTHGTFLNKEKIKPKSWVPCPPDAILRFGESTRQYILTREDCVVGPVHQSRTAVERLKEWAKANKSKIALDLVSEEEGEGRFMAKAAVQGGREALCTGQSNEEALELAAEELLRELEDADDDLDDDDDFYDRTKKKKKTNADTETPESLYAQLKELRLELNTLTVVEERVEDKPSGEEDELDAVIRDLEQKQAKGDQRILQGRAQALREQIERLERILRFVDPKGEFAHGKE